MLGTASTMNSSRNAVKGRAPEAESFSHTELQQNLLHGCPWGQRCFSIAKRADGAGADVLSLREGLIPRLTEPAFTTHTGPGAAAG